MKLKNWQTFLEYIADSYELDGKPREVFLTRFSSENWRKNDKEICELIETSLEVYKKHMTKVYEKLGGISGCPELDPRNQGPGKFGKLLEWLRHTKHPEWLINSRATVTTDTNPFNYEAPVPLNSCFYVERPPVESDCYQAIRQPGALIRIKAARQMGKTSLLDRILAYAGKQGYRRVRLNLLQVEEAKFSDLDKFLRWFCTYISDKLQSSHQLNDYWNEDRGSMTSCTRYFEVLLRQEDNPLVLGLDGIDRVFQHPEVTQDFFYLLRSWHEEANNLEIWEQLRLVVVHCTEDYGRLDINQSPFNVGLPVELEEFTQAQVEELVQKHRLDWYGNQAQQLMAMVGGHPCLVQSALFYLAAHPEVTVEKFLQSASTDAGIYGRHLRPLLVTLRDQPDLAAAFKQVITTNEPVQLGVIQGYKLHSMGLIKWQDNQVIPRCELYKLYFRERLET
ncbi:AAA-like domain-containing protein [Nostoc sp. FACHB-892]|uniref:AAA-like domain-containing protein n=1 Tax=Nostoc sp. FACHB-892 TaxID=2692843 RepID=UPI0016872E86|nr:AAA-like domain-containing protein [Nostoc sp. FACHB-892]MBD2731297.1 AAA-like domain-containing protein [Nostoc sp. FACHB-892]